jgi:hypothetical protein
MRWLAVVVLVLLIAGCSGSGGSVQGSGGDRASSQGRVGFHLPL